MKKITLLVIVTLSSLFFGCGGGSSSSDGSVTSKKYDAANSVYELGAGVNDITGLTNWMTVIYDVILDDLYSGSKSIKSLNSNNNFMRIIKTNNSLSRATSKEFYTDRQIDCLYGGKIIINGSIDNIIGESATYDLNITLNSCIAENTKSTLNGNLISKGFLGDSSENWDTIFEDFTIANSMLTNGRLVEEANQTVLWNSILNADVSNSTEKVKYNNFVFNMITEDKVEVKGSYTISKSNFSCIEKTYTIKTISSVLDVNFVIPLEPIGGKIDINNVTFDFHPDQSADVQDGTDTWSMSADDYNHITCDN